MDRTKRYNKTAGAQGESLNTNPAEGRQVAMFDIDEMNEVQGMTNAQTAAMLEAIKVLIEKTNDPQEAIKLIERMQKVLNGGKN